MQLQDAMARLEEVAIRDALTGLFNRRHFRDMFEQQLHQANEHRQSLGVLLIDLDHFKRVNDELGHAAGDAVLMQLRERFSTVFRDTDYMVRWGGEEFLIVARATDRSHALQLGERVRLAVANAPFALEGGAPIYKTCSVGFACFPLCPTRPSLLDWSKTINVADAALYVAKSRGRNACA